MEEKTKSMFEPLSLLDPVGFGSKNVETNYGNNNTVGSQKPTIPIRRSRSASDMMRDAQNAVGELHNFHEVEYRDEFEPLPFNSSFNFNLTSADLNIVDPVNLGVDIHEKRRHELNNNQKKRGRTRSLLRRSSSFDSVFSIEPILQALKLQGEEKTKEIFEPLPLLDSFGFGSEKVELNYNNDIKTGSHKPMIPIRRSKSTSNMLFDAQNAFGELQNFYEAECQDEFEPLPFNSSANFNVTDKIYQNVILEKRHERNSSKKKRRRKKSLLRRSNSFESLSSYDKGKDTKHVNGASPLSSTLHFPLTHSHIDSCTHTTGSSPNSMPRAIDDANINIQRTYLGPSRDPNNEGIAVPAHQGMNIVFTDGCKALSTKPTFVGNNRLRVLVDLQRERFRELSSVEQQKTASDLVETIALRWKCQLLVENGLSYVTLSHKEATDAMCGLLLNGTGNNIYSREDDAGPLLPVSAHVSSTLYVNTSSTSTSSSLLSAPQLPEFLRNASNEILNSGKSELSDQMTTRERQAVAVEMLKERNKIRQLANNEEQTPK
uniref:Uncharacterized protein n=1 Tax=Pseudo-nitzschia australis TaxID=44445 RepID=A0A7S4AFQ4_9STRA|mmetsp:Transcript_19276/g.41909  ORF Transcript_19276/g.41909 Transcript_19276/m.41909 type:complete len:546 (-) Transcript_19276:432-2069(-)